MIWIRVAPETGNRKGNRVLAGKLIRNYDTMKLEFHNDDDVDMLFHILGKNISTRKQNFLVD